MTDEARAALDRLTPEQRARFSKAMAWAFADELNRLAKGGQPAEETEQRRTLDDPAPEIAI